MECQFPTNHMGIVNSIPVKIFPYSSGEAQSEDHLNKANKAIRAVEK
jgi:hypothetical protein